jgi:hypothetical protein
MNLSVRLTLTPSPEQQARLVALQTAFAQVCNEIAPIVQQTRVWNRVALHHMAYKGLREKFPALGSQMVCNAIYSVSRASRLIFQTPGSPVHISRMAGQPLPLLRFANNCPVYFDRHTLSLKQGQVSMFTLDGRMKFELALQPEHELAFHTRRLLEIVLQRRGEAFELCFVFGPLANAVAASELGQPAQPAQVLADETAGEPSLQSGGALKGAAPVFPDYLKLEEAA